MADRFHTVILVPHSRAQLRKWQISTRSLKLIAGTLVLALIGSGLATVGFLRSSVDRHELDRLRSENASLKESTDTFESDLLRLQQQLTTYEDRTRQLAIVAGLDTLSSADATGTGGSVVGGEDLLESQLQAMEMRTGRLGANLDQVAGRLEDRVKKLSATPSVAPVKGIITSGFGMRRDPVNGRPSFHPAIDIGASPGFPVIATADGVVIKAGHSGALGNAVQLAHGYGFGTAYGHMSRVAVNPGQRIKRGEIVGYVGNTGRATGYHLHYEVHVDGEAVNPLPYILDNDVTARQ